MYDKERGAFLSRSFDISVSSPAVDMHKEGVSRRAKSISTRGMTDSFLDVNAWLPAAAEHYNISRDIRDFVLHPTVVNVSGLPNTNADGFNLRDWLTFRPQFGQLAYKTFKGKPTFVEHQNDNYKIASGVIFDAQMAPLPQFGRDRARLVLLLAFDRSRQPELCKDILSGTHNTYSKGTWYKSYTCSVCGETFNGRSRPCTHLSNRVVRLPNGLLAYRQCHELEGFETSAVRSPAFVCASPDPESVMDPRNKERW